MNRIKIYGIKALLFLCLVSGLFSSCEKDDFNEELTPLQQVNKFVKNYNELYYLWSDKIDYNKSYLAYSDPFVLFEEFVYRELDQWSFLTDDAAAMMESYEGVETTYGYRLTIIYFSDLKEYAAVVNFVYPDSPAEKAGIKKGDIIYLIDGSPITESNYINLYYSSAMVVELGTINKESGKLQQSGTTFDLVAVKMELDPVIAHTIVEKDGHKIGYICYTDYLVSSHTKMNRICDEFKSAGVTDVVLDLRYNLGGAAASASYITSLFAPRSTVSNKEVFLKEVWNATLTNYWISQGEILTQTFDAYALGHNLDLKRLYVLTSANTASASEATIVGLEPYMDVVTIGENTHGKYCAALLMQPVDNNGELIPEISNWAMSLVAYKYANKDGFTDFTGGLKPDHEVKNDYLSALPFGDTADPLFAKAIELITGKTSQAAVCSNLSQQSFAAGYRVMDGMTGKLNVNKGGLVKVRADIVK
ncbi:MAG: PDZ domain-containing protein [Bacteroidales bacterium]|nr:PDZ domain-containing protein [Bacteroidales bacterium]